MWWNQYVKVPFADRGRDWSGCDCWGLVRLVLQEQKKVSLPSVLEYETCLAKKDAEALIDKGKALFGEVFKPKDFDVVVLKVSGLAAHVGIVCNSGKSFLHVQDKIGATIESLNSIHWKARIESYWRLYEHV